MATTAADAYPEARFERTVPSTVSPPVAVVRNATPPRSRHFSFDLDTGPATRNTLATPRLVGPVVIQSVVWKHRTAGDPPVYHLEVGWATAPVSELGVALTAAKAWNALCQRVPGLYGGTLTQNLGLTQVNAAGAGSVTTEEFPAPMLVTAAELYVVVSFINNSGVTPASSLVEVTLLENVSPEVAANFR